MKHDIIKCADYSVDQFVYRMIYGKDGNFGPKTLSIGFLDPLGTLEAGAVFHNWYPEWKRVEVSIGALHGRWLSRERIKAFYDVVTELNCHSMICSIDASNLRARKIMRSLGGVEHIIAEYRGPGKAECLTVVTVEAFHNTIFGDGYGRESS